MKREKGEGQDQTPPLGDVLVRVAVTQYSTLSNLQRETVHLSLLCFQEVHCEDFLAKISLWKTEREDSIHTWESERVFIPSLQPFHGQCESLHEG